MRRINKDEIDLVNLKHIYSSDVAETYRDDELVYKFFNNPSFITTKDRLRKARIISGYRRHLDKHIILPKDLIVTRNSEEGYTSKLIKNSKTLYSHQIDTPEGLKEFYYYLYDVCKLLKNLHDNKIVMSDFHFFNVLIQNKDVYLIDFDNVRIENYYSYISSFLLYAFTEVYGIPLDYTIYSEDTDKLSLLLSILQMFSREQCIFLTDKRYGKLSEQYTLVNNIIAELNRVIRQRAIKDIPWPTELVSMKKRPL